MGRSKNPNPRKLANAAANEERHQENIGKIQAEGILFDAKDRPSKAIRRAARVGLAKNENVRHDTPKKLTARERRMLQEKGPRK